MKHDRLFYHFLAFLVVAVWGVTFISTKVLIGAGLHPALIFAIRFTLAYAGIWIITAVRKDGVRLWSDSFREEQVFLFLGITGGSFYFLTENTALAYTQACNVAFLVCSAPLITTLLSVVFKRLFKGPYSDSLEDVRPCWQLVLGTVLALAGMAVVIFDGTSFGFSAKGDILALCAALCWGLYSLFMGRMTSRYGTVFATRKVFFYGLLTIIPFLTGKDGGALAEAVTQFPVWGNLLFLGLIASLACFIVWNRVMAELGNVTATNYVYLNPFFTLVSAVIFLGEKMTLMAALGSAAIFAGVFLAEKNKA